MLGRIVAVTLTLGGLGLPLCSNAAMAQSDGAVAAGVITGLAVGAAVATGAIPMEHREPLRAHIYAELTGYGSTADAYASPNSGPSSRSVPASWDGKVVVPPFGMVVVRTSAPSASPSGAGHVVQFAVNRKVLEYGDTLKTHAMNFGDLG